MTPVDFRKPEWHQASPGFFRRSVRIALRDLALLVVLLVAAEGLLRVAMPELRKKVFTAELTGGQAKVQNSYGLRDHEFPRERPAEETRIICLGNSTTYGSGVALDDTYPKQLQKLLSEDGPALVINAGGEGTSLAKTMKFLDRDGYSFDPKVVVLGFSPATVASTVAKGETVGGAPGPEEAGSHSGPPKPPRKDFKQLLLMAHGTLYSSYAYVFWDTEVRKRLYGLGVLKDAIDKKDGAIFGYAFNTPTVDEKVVDGGYRTVGGQLANLRRQLDERRIKLIVLNIPSRFELSDDPRDNERNFPLERIRIHPSDRIRAELEPVSIRFIDLLPRMRAERQAMLQGQRAYEPFFIPGDYSHLDEKGHALAAEALRAALQDDGI